MDQHVGGLQADSDDTGQEHDHGVGPRLRRLLQARQPVALDGLDLLAHHGEAGEIAADLVQGVGRQGCALRRHKRLKLLGRPTRLDFAMLMRVFLPQPVS